MDKQLKTIKIWRASLSNLRLLAGIKEQPMVYILDILIKKALEYEYKNKNINQ